MHDSAANINVCTSLENICIMTKKSHLKDFGLLSLYHLDAEKCQKSNCRKFIRNTSIVLLQLIITRRISDLSYPNLLNWWVKLVMLGLPSDYNQNMAIKFIAPFSVLLFFPSSCQAKPENFSEAQCKVLPVGQETAPEFCVQASEKGVRIVYLDLKFRNDSYRPLESENEFLPNRWVWASLISEPMLSLSYDYDILSLGLLKYQTRSIEMLLEDQPSGCLSNFNSSCQKKVVGRELLSLTQLNSGEPPDRSVICVAMIEDYFRDFLCILFDGNVKFQCCEMSKEETTESAYIQCGLDVQVSGWFKAFRVTF